MAKKIINPDNLSPSILYPDIEPKAKYFPPAVADNIPKFFTYFGFGTLALGTIGILLITDPLPTCEEEEKDYNNIKVGENLSSVDEVLKAKEGMETSSDSNKAPLLGKKEVETSGKPKGVVMEKTEIKPVSWKDFAVFKDRDFQYTFVTLIITYLYPQLGLFSFKSIGLDHLTDSWIVTCGVFGSITNALIRVVIGMSYKRFGYAACAFFIMFVEISSCLILIPSTKNETFYLISLCWFFITYGGQLGLYPLVSDTLFKSKGAFSYSFLFSAFTLSNILILLLQNFIKEKIGIENLLYGLAVINLLPTFSILKLNKKIKELSQKTA